MLIAEIVFKQIMAIGVRANIQSLKLFIKDQSSSKFHSQFAKFKNMKKRKQPKEPSKDRLETFVKDIKEELESQKREEVVAISEEIKDELVTKVDSFLGYVAEEWVKENELAIERGLKSELTENFIQGLKSLFEDHYVEVPDDKLDVVDELASKIEEVEAKLNEEVSKNIDLSQERDELVRTQVVSEVSSDLTTSEVEKLTKLIEDLDQDEDFAQNVQTIKESYFSDSKEKLQLDEEVVSDSDENTSTEDKVLNPSMAAYSAALGKIDPNKYS